jgi:YYY domain-containing protein
VYFPHVVDVSANPEPKTLEVTLASVEAPDRPLGAAQLVSDLLPQDDPRGEGVWLSFNPPLSLERDRSYLLQIRLEAGAGAIQITGSSIANESSWDDGLPMRVDGYDGFGGIYQGGLTFELYWEDNAEKRERFKDILQRADYLMISSSRQWGSITRLPEKYPLTTAYYRYLLGCPSERTLEWCYNVADVGRFQGELGFELVAVFQSNPSLGQLTINDQFAEEAFTVYDHPKVFIFRKSPDFDPQRVADLLDAVELETAQAAAQPGSSIEEVDLTLPPGRWAEQQAGGTWVELFPPQSWLNHAPWLAAVVWYLSVWGLGLIAYPLLRIAMVGLEDRGYPLSRITGLLLLAYLVWLGGSFRLPVTRTMISLAMGVLLIVSALLAYVQRDALRREWRERRRYLLFIEGLALALFLFDLFIRLGNPDLWHPYKGGEKPMDFSYLNAVLKSTSFPPYDPWYAGGYINYYYYGFVVVGMLVKWLGIQPSVAYNLIIPTLFSLIGLGAFSIGWNVIHRSIHNGQSSSTSLTIGHNLKQRLPYLVGVATTLGMAVLGNLGIIRMLVLGYQRLVAPGGMVEEGGLWQRLIWTVQGFFRVLSGTPLPYRMDEWYWNPSRVIPPQGDTEPITEFPFFTVLYADLHAHLIAIPIALLVLAWALSVIFSRGWRDSKGISLRRTLFNAGFGLFFGGLAIGALYPTNLSDVYAYLPLGAVAVGYALWRYRVGKSPAVDRRTAWTVLRKRAMFTLLGVLVLVGLSIYLYQPYARWYAQAYSTVHLWKGPRTPLGSYLSQWGLFLFLVVTWMIWETREWMAATPLSALRKLAPYKALIQGGLLLVLVGIVALQYYGVRVAWLVIPLILWTGLLLLRPGLPDSKRVVLFLSGTALALTLMVELVVVSGDIGRMNTVFKFYLQAWTMFAIAAAVAFGWLVMALPAWLPKWRQIWLVLVTALVAGAALFPVLGGLAKIKDRMAPEAPHTLDGAAFMQYATYYDLNRELDLSQDYRAIRWMQENVPGSPVIIEANSLNLYHWFSRFTIYTGLPGVVGWDWHQRQQRALDSPEEVTHRVTLVGQFYLTTDVNEALQILEQFNVRYIILGQLERASYPGPGLEKFPQYEGRYWRRVYQDAETEIYQVIRTNE